jgi:HEPN domain-containing protein
VNDGLAHGRYFFMDVKRDGIAIYQTLPTELHEPKPKTPPKALEMAREYFDEWFPAAAGRLDTAKYTMSQGRLKEAVFDMHQASEFLYHCVLLVVTFYTPHVHNIGFLRTQAERLDRRLVDAWPRENRFEQRTWEKLKDAYVKARYSKHYRISEAELEWLKRHIEELGRVVHEICSERIAELEAKANASRARG